jgi:hypothetical protein
MAQDRLLELLQRGAWMQAKLLVERLAHVLVGRECVRLAFGAIEGEHLLSAQALAQRVHRDQRLELSDELRGTSAEEIGVDPILQRGELKLLEMRRLGRGKRFRELAQRRPAPQGERVAQVVGRRATISRRKRGAPLLGQPQEAIQVQELGVELQDVPRRPCVQDRARQDLAQPRDVDLHHLRAAVGDCLAPETVDEALARDGASRVEHEHRKQRTRAAARQLQWTALVDDLQRAENPELHGAS